ncbi:MAG TPA: ECF-type sigma factor [Longimicrobiales bacterium]|nr:ECF-type sigma factor [Longimicrobiales bacterium]
MKPTASRDLAPLLDRLRDGDEGALDELFPLVYAELHRLARRQRRGWDGNETLNTTALLHEAYLKLADQDRHDWEDRAHFLHAASRAMRHVLINYAERRSAEKRGGGRPPVTLDKVADVLRDPGRGGGHELEALIALDRALERLGEEDRRNGRIVECRVFGGMTIRETARALGISEATVSRGWAVAQAWLRRELLGDPVR